MIEVNVRYLNIQRAELDGEQFMFEPRHKFAILVPSRLGRGGGATTLRLEHVLIQSLLKSKRLIMANLGE